MRDSARDCSELNGTRLRGSCCLDCLGIGDFNYNVFHSIVFLVSILSLPMGFLFDKVGNSASILVGVCSVVGFGLVSVAGCLPGLWVTLPLMFVGGGIWGLGYMQSSTARERFLGIWFISRELRLAFGLSAGINKSGILLSYVLTVPVRESVGLQFTLWIGTLICGFSLACAVCASALDAYGNRRLGLTTQIKQEASKVGFFDLRHASFEYWLLLGGFSLFATSTVTFQANSIEFISEKFNFSNFDAGLTAGLLQYPGIVLAPLGGLVVDKLGRSCFFFVGSALLLVSGLSILTFSDFHPVIGNAMLGVADSLVSSAAFASVPLVVPQETLGIATSLILCVESLALVLLHAAVGWVLGGDLHLARSEKLQRWYQALLLILLTAFAALAFAASLLVWSWLRDGILARGRQKRGPENLGHSYLLLEGASHDDDSN